MIGSAGLRDGGGADGEKDSVGLFSGERRTGRRRANLTEMDE